MGMINDECWMMNDEWGWLMMSVEWWMMNGMVNEEWWTMNDERRIVIGSRFQVPGLRFNGEGEINDECWMMNDERQITQILRIRAGAGQLLANYSNWGGSRSWFSLPCGQKSGKSCKLLRYADFCPGAGSF